MVRRKRQDFMNFGDILDKWEKQHTGKNNGLAVNMGGPESEERVNPIDAWLRVNGIYDKDTENPDSGQSSAEKRRRLRHKKADASIDIHGLTRDEAWETMERFFNDAKGKEFEKLLIIHGKGNHSAGEAVLKKAVREFIERCPFAGESGQEKAATGGEGATWVLLK